MNHDTGSLDASARSRALPVRSAIDGRQVRTVFQPIVSLRDGSLVAYEALARVGPGYGGLPEPWLRAADVAGIRPELELLCLESAAEAGPPPPGVALFVNVSLTTAADPRVLDLRDRLHDDLVIDLTEHDLAPTGRTEVGTALGPLLDRGVRLSIDDVSAISLLDLAGLRPSHVKIAPEVVRGLDLDDDRRALVAALVSFGRDIGFSVVAEGVERRSEAEVLSDVGVDCAQGFLFGRPSSGWTTPTQRRSTIVSTVDSDHGLRHRLGHAEHATEACERAVESLHDDDTLVSVYFERRGVLRCQAQRGYGQVLDGIPVARGIMARAFRSESAVVVQDAPADPDFLATTQGIVAEVAEPLRVRGRVIGCLNVESRSPFDSEKLARISRAALMLSNRLERLRIELADSALTRLARSSTELSGLSDRADVERAVVRLACDVARMSSSALFLPADSHRLSCRATQGPLTDAFASFDEADLHQVTLQLGDIASCHTSYAAPAATLPGLERLRGAGASSAAALRMDLLGRGRGLLLVADHAPVALDTEVMEAMELLASEAARAIDLAEMVTELRDRATRDPITGLQNQRAFAEAMSAIGGRRAGTWAVVMADIDGFKAVNDTHGHLVGDRLLRELADALSETVRPMDRVYRVGGDEFAAILPEVDADGATEVGARLCRAARSVLTPYAASLSVGIAVPRPGETSEELVDRADATLYDAKRTAPGTSKVAER